MIAWLARIWRAYVSDLRDSVDAECAEYRASAGASKATREMAIVVFTAAATMVFVRFAGNEDDLAWVGKLLHGLGLHRSADDFMRAMTKSPNKRIYLREWWAGARLLGYGVIPLLSAKLFLPGKLGQYGISGTGKSQAKIYFLLFAIVAPFVFAASFGTGFQEKYPYYKVAKGEALFPNFVLWECLYASQFVGLELFFRGFLIQGLRRPLGYAAVLFPIVPYATIHFGKPLPEALGSIVTGFVLGTMALKTRSIWGGAAIHVSVACSMDVLSLWHRGLLFH